MEEILHQLIDGLFISLFVGFQPSKVVQDFVNPQNVKPYGSKHCLRRYSSLQIIPQTLPKKVLGSIGKELEAKFPTFRPKLGPFGQDSPMELLPIDTAWLVRTQGLCSGGSRRDFMFFFKGFTLWLCQNSY